MLLITLIKIPAIREKGKFKIFSFWFLGTLSSNTVFRYKDIGGHFPRKMGVRDDTK